MGSRCFALSSSDAYFRRSRKLRCFPSMSSDDDDDDLIGRPSSSTASPISVLHGPHSSAADFLHRFRLRAELGQGEFGVTRRCSDATTGEVLAYKSISKQRLCTTFDISDVRWKIEIMHGLPQHPNTVQLREAYEDREAVHLVMEIYEGGELFDRIVARGRYTERVSAIIFKTIVATSG